MLDKITDYLDKYLSSQEYRFVGIIRSPIRVKVIDINSNRTIKKEYAKLTLIVSIHLTSCAIKIEDYITPTTIDSNNKTIKDFKAKFIRLEPIRPIDKQYYKDIFIDSIMIPFLNDNYSEMINSKIFETNQGKIVFYRNQVEKLFICNESRLVRDVYNKLNTVKPHGQEYANIIWVKPSRFSTVTRLMNEESFLKDLFKDLQSSIINNKQ